MKNRKFVLAGIVVLIAVAMALPFVTNVYGKKSEEHVFLRDIDVKVNWVNDSHANPEFIVTVHRSEIVTNATLVISVYDRNLDILLDRYYIEIPKKSAKGIDEVKANVPLEKDKTYRITFKIEKNNEIVDGRAITLSGLDTLLPKDKMLKMTLKDVDFYVIGINDGKVNVRARFYIQSMDDYSDVLFHIKAIQAESNVLADGNVTVICINYSSGSRV